MNIKMLTALIVGVYSLLFAAAFLISLSTGRTGRRTGLGHSPGAPVLEDLYIDPDHAL